MLHGFLRVQGSVSASHMFSRKLVMVLAKGILDFRKDVILS